MINTANAKGIIFSTSMVKAIQERRKTQTRRVIKPQPPEDIESINGPEWYTSTVIDRHGMIEPGPEVYGIYAEYDDWGVKCPHMPGDILYVRETWIPTATIDSWLDNKKLYIYKANFPDNFKPGWKWRSPLYMPKEAARIWLEVTGVRAERVQDITAEDCVEEGMDIDWSDDMPKPAYVSLAYYKIKIAPAYKKAFAELWDSINAKPKPVYRTVEGRKIIARYESYPWEDVQETREYRGKEWWVHGNPYVFVYSFRDVSGEVEA